MPAKKPTKAPAAAPAADSEPTQINLRAPTGLVARLDEWAATLNAKSHARWTRNAIILAVCERALAERGEKGEAP